MTLLDEYYAAKAARNNYNRHPLDDGKSILSPLETEVRVEGMFRDTTNILEPNRFGEYEFQFLPVSQYDYGMLDSKIEEVMSHWFMEKGMMIDIRPFNNIKTKHGFYKCSQLFQPKLNLLEPDNPYFPMCLAVEGRKADLAMHFRDAPNGEIYLQCSYVDINEPEPEPVIEYSSDEGDDDFWA